MQSDHSHLCSYEYLLIARKSKFWKGKSVVRLCRCTGWSKSSLFMCVMWNLCKWHGILEIMIIINSSLFIKSCCNCPKYWDTLTDWCNYKYLNTLRCIFQPFLQTETTFVTSYLFTWAMSTLHMESSCEEKNLLSEEQILLLKGWLPLRKETKVKTYLPTLTL